ncbi:alpha/beta hydrolase [Stieleria marina]|uniref:Alpha/beta hydrolase family protein n=1 Tax=Stieleria marina TaxID=1930275 RepID=A0A517NZA8_9BACT|nr:Alpha/beta hydrolase family protein [Planctomycetes bacterium K23_9]
MKPTATTQAIKPRDKSSKMLMGVFYFCVCAVIVILLANPAFAQKKKEEDPKLKPRPVVLKTDDGLALRAFYFPSDKGKEAVTVMLVHEWQGQASPYGKLCMTLRNAGCAVIVPDYRGHGGSKEYTDARGKVRKFNIAQMGKRDVENIVRYDLEEAKRFLKKRNNDEELNLNALVVIGVREGCVMAAHWAQRDWSFAPVGSKKRGQDVKALVLISPKKVFKGVSLDQTLSNPAILSLPMMLVAGQGSPEESEAERVYKRVEAVRKRIHRGDVEGLNLHLSKASFSGPQLVAKTPDVLPAVVQFVKKNVVISEDEEINPWVNRE